MWVNCFKGKHDNNMIRKFIFKLQPLPDVKLFAISVFLYHILSFTIWYTKMGNIQQNNVLHLNITYYTGIIPN